MGCPPVQDLIKHAGISDEMEEFDQDTHHSVQSLHVPEEGDRGKQIGIKTTIEAPVATNEVEYRERINLSGQRKSREINAKCLMKRQAVYWRQC